MLNSVISIRVVNHFVKWFLENWKYLLPFLWHWSDTTNQLFDDDDAVLMLRQFKEVWSHFIEECYNFGVCQSREHFLDHMSSLLVSAQGDEALLENLKKCLFLILCADHRHQSLQSVSSPNLMADFTFYLWQFPQFASVLWTWSKHDAWDCRPSTEFWRRNSHTDLASVGWYAAQLIAESYQYPVRYTYWCISVGFWSRIESWDRYGGSSSSAHFEFLPYSDP